MWTLNKVEDRQALIHMRWAGGRSSSSVSTTTDFEVAPAYSSLPQQSDTALVQNEQESSVSYLFIRRHLLVCREILTSPDSRHGASVTRSLVHQ